MRARRVLAGVLCVAWGLVTDRAGAVLYSVNLLEQDEPQGYYGSSVTGISGLIFVGQYSDTATSLHGYISDGKTFDTLDDPDGVTTYPKDLSGNYIVGSYTDSSSVVHGFYFDGNSFTTLDYPGSSECTANSISLGVIVGTFEDSSGAFHGFVYNGTAFTPFDAPEGPNLTWANGIDSGRIVGYYKDAQNAAHAYLYDPNTGFTSVDHPLAANYTVFSAISGNLIVGYYVAADSSRHGFLYDGTTFTPLDAPAGNDTTPLGISGRLAVGFYQTATSAARGFVALVSPGPIILTPPANVTVGVGQSANFTVTTKGVPRITYQWEFNGKAIKGATKASYAIARVAAANAGKYLVVASNPWGYTISATAVLTVVTPVKVTKAPVSQTVSAGGGVQFSVSATGTGPLSYQWQFASKPPTYRNIAGAKGTFYVVLDAQAANAGSYRVVVTNAAGSVASGAGKLVVRK